MKLKFGFNYEEEKPEVNMEAVKTEEKKAKRSLVEVYFPHRHFSCTYYNDLYDLKVGDLVYVEGKLEGFTGRVTQVNYTFKIKLSDYKKVTHLVDTSVSGEFFLAGSHMFTYDETALPFEKVLSWFTMPEKEEEIVSGEEGEGFFLFDLNELNISMSVWEKAKEYYIDNSVLYVELKGKKGRAVVKGSQAYSVEFNYDDGHISNLTCSCYCTGICKHEVAVLMQLRETIELIENEYADRQEEYMAIVNKDMLLSFAVGQKKTGKVTF